MSYPRYDEYRDSRVEWLGEIPAHWDTDRLKWSAKGCKNGIWGSEPDGDDDLVCIRVADFDRRSFKVDTEQLTLRAIRPKDRNGRILAKGDLLIEKSGGGEKQPVGAVVFFDHDFDAVSSNFVARMPIVENMDGRFWSYVHAHLYSSRVNTRSIKQTTGIQNLDSQQYLDESIAFPPLPEQRSIARFLDYKTAQIDALIAKKEALLAKLAEKRTALISQAVTKGLDPDAPMKDSGIEWLGEIPAHWTMKRLKHVAKVQSGITLGKKYSGEIVTMPYLRVANVQDGYLDLQTITTIDLPPDKVDRYLLRTGDVLMTEGGDFDKLGRGYVWDGQIDECLHQNHIFAVRPDTSKLNSHYLAALTSSSHGKNYYTRSSQQTTNLATINQTSLMNFELPLPPITEQKQILEALNTTTDRIGQQHNQVQSAIDKLNEYRTSLITHAVTGQINVRDFVPPEPSS